MKESITIDDLKVGDIFYVNKEWGFCELKEIRGFSFFTGQICLWLEVCDLSKPKSHIEMFFKQTKKVKLFE